MICTILGKTKKKIYSTLYLSLVLGLNFVLSPCSSK